MPDSSTGGYLVPNEAPLASDQGIIDFVHDILVGVTGLANELVRPSWQADPPPTPDADVNWMAFGLTSIRTEPNGYEEHDDDGVDVNTIEQASEVDVLCVFYGPSCVGRANLLGNAFLLGQNREAMNAIGIKYGGISDVIHAPELVNDRYIDRADTTLTVRFPLTHTYPILHFLEANGTTVGLRAVTKITTTFDTGPEV